MNPDDITRTLSRFLDSLRPEAGPLEVGDSDPSEAGPELRMGERVLMRYGNRMFLDGFAALPDVARCWLERESELRRLRLRAGEDPEKGLDAITVPTPGDLTAARELADREDAAEALRVFVTALRKVDPREPRAYPVKVTRGMSERVWTLVKAKLLGWDIRRSGDTYHLSPAMTVPPTHP